MDRHEQDRQSEDGHGAGKPHLLALCLLSLLALLTLSLVLAASTALESANLLTNGGFEDGTEGWTASSVATFVTVTDPVSSGNWAASLYKSGTIGEIWIRQDVSVLPSAAYTLTGWIYDDDAKYDQVCLRIRWRASDWLGAVQDCLEGDYDFYRAITLPSVIAPPDAVTARIMAVADISTASPQEPVYFDDLSFTSNIPPTPTPMAFYVPLVVKSYPSAP